MTKICSYCLNSPRLTTPPGAIAGDDHTKFDCPVCQENRVLNNSGEEIPEDNESFDEENEMLDLVEDLRFDDVDDFDEDEEDYEEEDEDYDQF